MYATGLLVSESSPTNLLNNDCSFEKKTYLLFITPISISYLHVPISLGTEYCGRRFANAEELLVHVKTHTNLSTSDPRALSILNAASSAPPTSHQRFHPYARPSVGVGSTPPTAPPPPSVTAPMPPALAALASNPYASLYTSCYSTHPKILSLKIILKVPKY